MAGYTYTSYSLFSSEKLDEKEEGEEEEPEPPRNFTLKQLRYFDGTPEEKSGEPKPVYLSINGIVFDVSGGRNFYGPDGPYALFAGHECGAALAKMSFEKEMIDNLDACKELNFGERQELEGWIDKFTHYRNYPVKGRLISESRLPDPSRILSPSDLADGTGKTPEGYGAAPIYVGAGTRVFDVSFGGVTFYGAGGPYAKFAGKDASRALAKMSLEDLDLETSDISDCTEKQLKTLADWIETFGERKQYPVVGTLKK